MRLPLNYSCVRQHLIQGIHSKDNLISLAKLYPSDFDSVELRELNTCSMFILLIDVWEDDRFFNIQTIVELFLKN